MSGDHVTLVERRTENATLLVLVQQIIDDLKQVNENFKSLDQKLTRHMTDETIELSQEITRLLISAFPEGDPHGHRSYHIAQMAAAEARAGAEKERRDFWKKMVFELTKGGLLIFCGWVAVTLWQGFLKGPK